VPKWIEREQIGIAGDDQIGMAVYRQFQELLSVGSRHAAIRSTIVAASAPTISFSNQARVPASISDTK
jgi:hypothetical protein